MKKLLFFILALTVLIACSKTEEKKNESADQETVTTQETPQPGVNHRYGIKSGVIISDSPKGKTELYFDDYGVKKVTVTYVDSGIAKSKLIDIVKDGFSYVYSEGKKEGAKIPSYFKDQDFSKADSATWKLYKVKYLGTELIKDKECKKFSAEFGGSPFVRWTWNNILVKQISKVNEKDVVIEAKILETSIDSKMFELPDDVTFKEI
jgi:hypothetical protein